MTHSALLIRLSARPGKEQEVEEFLHSALTLVEQEPDTTAWFGVRFGRGEYGIFDTFSDDAARQAHLDGPVTSALLEQREELFEAAPRVQKLEVLADKLPTTTVGLDTKGLLLTFKAKTGHEQDVEQFLRGAQPFVMDEPKTTAWFAIRTEEGEYGIFDVFPDTGARLAHLTGHVPRELAKNALSLLGSVPEVEMVNVTAEKLSRVPLARS